MIYKGYQGSPYSYLCHSSVKYWYSKSNIQSKVKKR